MKKVLLDANVFVTFWMLDVLLSFAESGLFEPRWSVRVLEEAEKALYGLIGIDGNPFARMRICLERAFPCALIEEPYPSVTSKAMPDKNDLHVVAAALASGCEEIVTYNIRDFPRDALSPLGLRARHPDEFCTEVLQGNPEATMRVMRDLVKSKSRPSRTMTEELAGLRKNCLTRFAQALEEKMI